MAIFIKQIRTLTSNILFDLLKKYVAGERVDLLDDYDFPPGTITEMAKLFSICLFWSMSAVGCSC